MAEIVDKTKQSEPEALSEIIVTSRFFLQMEHEFDVPIICWAGIRLSDHHERHSLSESLRPMQRSMLFENIFSEGASNGLAACTKDWERRGINAKSRLTMRDIKA